MTAEKLYTSQPGVSKQIKLLEDELGVQIFIRSGKHLSDITPIGKKIVDIARDVLGKTQSIKVLASEYTQPNVGVLSIATTHTQARYILPSVIQKFIKHYPDINLRMEQGTSEQNINNVKNGSIDFAIVTELPPLTNDIVVLPCYHWNQAIIVPHKHQLASCQLLAINELAQYPLVSYDFSNDGSDINQAFIKANVTPNIVFSTSDADLIKTYVRLGIGIGIVAKMAINLETDNDFTVLNAGHIFPYSTTYIVFSRALFLRNYMYEFIYQFSSHLDKSTINNALSCEDNNQILTLFNGIKLPIN